jgi:hypothetical protein
VGGGDGQDDGDGEKGGLDSLREQLRSIRFRILGISARWG